MLEAHQVLEEELKRLKVAMEKEKERQRERLRQRRSVGKGDRGIDSRASTPIATTETAHINISDDDAISAPLPADETFPSGNQRNVMVEDAERKPPGPVVFYATKPPKSMKKSESATKKCAPSSNVGFSNNKHTSATTSFALSRPFGSQHNAQDKEAPVRTESERQPDNEFALNKIKREYLEAKNKYAASLKKVKAKELTLSKKENELKKKENRVQKLADNLRRQRVILKKTQKKATQPSELIKIITSITPTIGRRRKSEELSIPPKKLSPSKTKSNNKAEKAPLTELSERGRAKMSALTAVYDGKSKETDKAVTNEGEALLRKSRGEKALYDQKKLENSEEHSATAHASVTNNYSLLGASQYSRPSSLDPLIQSPAVLSRGPLSAVSAFGMSPGPTENSSHYKNMLREYNSNFEKALQKKRALLSREHLGIKLHSGADKDKLNITKKLTKKNILDSKQGNRSKSAKTSTDTETEIVRNKDSSSSRESRSAPEDMISMTTSLDLLMSDNKMADSKSLHKKKKRRKPLHSQLQSPLPNVNKAVKQRRYRRGPACFPSKKKMPTKPLQPIKQLDTAAQTKDSHQVSEAQQRAAMAKMSIILARKRMPLEDLLPSSVRSSITIPHLKFDLEVLMKEFGFSDCTDGILQVAREKCTDGNMTNLKMLERECRNAGGGRATKKKANPEKSAATGAATERAVGRIYSRGVAKNAYVGYKFSFEQSSVDKENSLSDDVHHQLFGEEEKAEGRWSSNFQSNRSLLLGHENKDKEDHRNLTMNVNNQEPNSDVGDVFSSPNDKTHPWLASFDKRMNDALKNFSDNN